MKNILLFCWVFYTPFVFPVPSKILFGSCTHQDKAMPILDSINREKGDVFIFLGDNVYGDTENMEILANKYQKLGNNPRFKTLQTNIETIAIWDDHDYGENDAGKEYPQKEASRQLMLDFWNEPKDSPRRSRSDGIYTSYYYGKGSKSVHIIMPDLRWNRDPVERVNTASNLLSRIPKDMGPYKPNEVDTATMLGNKQWQWLESELLKPAAIKIIAYSLQLLPEFTGWEAWANFPADRNRLLTFIKQNRINGVLIISGDTHWGELSKYDKDMDYPLWEVTSSGLTEEWKAVSPNRHRVGEYTHSVNYGSLEIDWDQDTPMITFGLKDIQGEIVTQQAIALSSISPYK